MGTHCNKRGFCPVDFCQNGGKCLEYDQKSGKGKCQCPLEFTGVNCEKDVDECELARKDGQHACRDNGECVNTFGSYKCVCKPGYVSEDCSIQENPEIECNDAEPDRQCQHGGVCIYDELKNNKTCECPKGYEGLFCEKDVDECKHYSPCQNYGTCQNTDGGYRCFCMDGFKGDQCQINEDDCIDNKCSPDSACIDGIKTYTCHCPIGKMGTYCQLVDRCTTEDPCLQGDCITDPLTGNYQCICHPGYTGKNCDQDIDECAINPNRCYNGGICVNKLGGYDCMCPEGYKGEFCEDLMNPCEEVQCHNGGKCRLRKSGNNTYVAECSCYPGFHGHDCTQKCPFGFKGAQCQEPFFPCKNSADCNAGGDCIESECICKGPFYGNRCEMRRRCQEGFCLNEGICEDKNNSATCNCRQSFAGERCEVKIDLCQNHRCKNGAICKQEKDIYKCECIEGTAGRFCEEKVDIAKFDKEERLEREICIRNRCSSKSGDDQCDLGCNLAACDFDGGDCSAKLQPFANCKFASYCAKNFANQICDKACNTEECLYDGYDCLAPVPRCPSEIQNKCAERYGDGICDVECNVEACGWDGGDCKRNETKIDDKVRYLKKNSKNFLFQVYKDIWIMVLADPSTFIKNVHKFLFAWSNRLRASVKIQHDVEGPMVFKWSSAKEDDLGSRIVMPKNENYAVSYGADSSSHHHSARSRRSVSNSRFHLTDHQFASPSSSSSSRGHSVDGIAVSVQIDMSHCQEDCFSDSEAFVKYWAAYMAKEYEEGHQGPLPIYKAIVRRPQPGTTGSPLSMLLLVVICAFVVIGTASAAYIKYGNQERRTRKRRTIHAPCWIPEKESDLNKRSLGSSNYSSGSQNSLISPCNSFFEQQSCSTAFFDPYNSDMKRRRLENGSAITYHNGIIVPPHINGHPQFQHPGAQNHYILPHNVHELQLAKARQTGYFFPSQQIHPNSSISPVDVKPNLASIISREAPNPNEGLKFTDLHIQAASKSLIDIELTEENANSVGPFGWTPLLSLLIGNPEAEEKDRKTETEILKDAEKLVTAGADVNWADHDERTALTLAVHRGFVSVARFLLERGANPKIMNKIDGTVLMIAIKRCHYSMVKLLLENKDVVEEINEVNRFGQTALMIASVVELANNQLGEMLVTKGADVSYQGDKTDAAQSYTGRTALHYAADVNNVTKVRFLLEHNANKDAGDVKDQTPMFLAASRGHLKVVEILIEAGASFEAPDNMDRTPCMIAYEKGHDHIVSYLENDNPRLRQPVRTSPLCKNMGDLKRTNAQAARSLVKAKRNRKLASTPQPIPSSGLPLHQLTPPHSDSSTSSPSPGVVGSSSGTASTSSSVPNLYHPLPPLNSLHATLLDSPDSDGHAHASRLMGSETFSPLGNDVVI
ncbi:hypothetical protein WR25_15182 isoform Q [Diploscapter pachys]|uniref:Uncharacterized protein n=1 Tax=Diploscapter pachys TaxID=2018661 RepID=A0A2A2KWR0_9BILA|nr:hypothetical protein WR25_15182 isoform Q [Diploscapter pachys]